MFSMCSPVKLLIQSTEFVEILYDRYPTTEHSNLVLSSFLQPVTTPWRKY
jgi:hypothetical protein